MKHALAILALLAGPAMAGTPLDPPAQYRGEVHPLERISVQVLPNREVAQSCAEAYNQAIRFDTEGCAVPMTDGSCVVYVVERPRRAPTLARLIAHEVAHCRGWPAHHPL